MVHRHPPWQRATKHRPCLRGGWAGGKGLGGRKEGEGESTVARLNGQQDDPLHSPHPACHDVGLRLHGENPALEHGVNWETVWERHQLPCRELERGRHICGKGGQDAQLLVDQNLPAYVTLELLVRDHI